jgi:hypothetical protein
MVKPHRLMRRKLMLVRRCGKKYLSTYKEAI